MRAAAWLAMIATVLGCSREAQPATEPTEKTPEFARWEPPKPKSEAPATPVAEPKPDEKPAEPDAVAEEPRLGVPREAVTAWLGPCAEQVRLLAGHPGARTVEVLQPKKGDCAEKLGAKHYVLVANRLDEIDPGLLEKLAPPTPPEDAPY